MRIWCDSYLIFSRHNRSPHLCAPVQSVQLVPSSAVLKPGLEKFIISKENPNNKCPRLLWTRVREHKSEPFGCYRYHRHSLFLNLALWPSRCLLTLLQLAGLSTSDVASEISSDLTFFMRPLFSPVSCCLCVPSIWLCSPLFNHFHAYCLHPPVRCCLVFRMLQYGGMYHIRKRREAPAQRWKSCLHSYAGRFLRVVAVSERATEWLLWVSFLWSAIWTKDWS